jgi:hypothetical protein
MKKHIVILVLCCMLLISTPTLLGAKPTIENNGTTQITEQHLKTPSRIQQRTTQRVVLAEAFIAITCSQCGYAERALTALLNQHPETLIRLDIHGGQSYEIPWGIERREFYDIPGFPTVWFDGTIEQIGANSVSEALARFQTSYQNRISAPTDVSIEIGAVHLTGSTYRVTTRISLESDGLAKTMRINMVHVLDHYPSSYDDRYRNCVREPSVAPEDITLQPGESRVISREFTFDYISMHRQNNMSIVVWAQEPLDSGPAEVYNAQLMNWPFEPLTILGDVNNDGYVNFEDVDPFTCALSSGEAIFALRYPNGNYWAADCNQDIAIDFMDIDSFIEILRR